MRTTVEETSGHVKIQKTYDEGHLVVIRVAPVAAEKPPPDPPRPAAVETPAPPPRKAEREPPAPAQPPEPPARAEPQVPKLSRLWERMRSMVPRREAAAPEPPTPSAPEPHEPIPSVGERFRALRARIPRAGLSTLRERFLRRRAREEPEIVPGDPAETTAVVAAPPPRRFTVLEHRPARPPPPAGAPALEASKRGLLARFRRAKPAEARTRLSMALVGRFGRRKASGQAPAGGSAPVSIADSSPEPPVTEAAPAAPPRRSLRGLFRRNARTAEEPAASPPPGATAPPEPWPPEPPSPLPPPEPVPEPRPEPEPDEPDDEEEAPLAGETLPPPPPRAPVGTRAPPPPRPRMEIREVRSKVDRVLGERGGRAPRTPTPDVSVKVDDVLRERFREEGRRRRPRAP